MKRRQLVKSVAAGSVLGLGSGIASAEPVLIDPEDLDAIHVVRDGERVRTVENPTMQEFDRLHDEISEDEQVVTPDGTCFPKCCQDCPPDCSSCGCACYCCDTGSNICSCCSQVDNPEQTTCCPDC
ncbi:hypothetical protein [Halorussus aquaticus]|uniref:Twin-arginine translocation signal domain-containing protein n=1 Tax=Halorussus aquaticus TaxID=2953748 RepID=A0ABD5PWS6_9EURY|nr:hypothetical protein [Halorussus aquaticus]